MEAIGEWYLGLPIMFFQCAKIVSAPFHVESDAGLSLWSRQFGIWPTNTRGLRPREHLGTIDSLDSSCEIGSLNRFYLIMYRLNYIL